MSLGRGNAEATGQRLAGVSWRIEAAGTRERVQGGKVGSEFGEMVATESATFLRRFSSTIDSRKRTRSESLGFGENLSRCVSAAVARGQPQRVLLNSSSIEQVMPRTWQGEPTSRIDLKAFCRGALVQLFGKSE